MCAPSSPAVRPFAGGVPRRAATAPSDASERTSGKKRPRVAPARDSSACLTKMTRNRNTSVVTAGGGEMSVSGKPAQERLKKRLASELDALRGLLKKAELISRGGGACKKERFLPSSNSNQRPKPMEDGGAGNAPSVKKRKISSTLVEQKQMRAPPRMSTQERNQLACRLSSLSGELPGYIVEFLQKQFGDADTNGEIEINIDSVEDFVLFQLKTRLDKFAEESKGDKVAEGSKGKVVPEQEEACIDICGVCPIIETSNEPSSSSSSDSDECVDRPAQVLPEQTNISTSEQPPSEPAQQSTEANKVQDVQRVAPKAAVYMPGLIYRANVRRQLLEMERAGLVLPDESIHQGDLQRLCIAEYGLPSVMLMRQIGLVLKADA